MSKIPFIYTQVMLCPCDLAAEQPCRYVHLGDPLLKSQSACAWQNSDRLPQREVRRSQNQPVKPWRHESLWHRPSDSGRLSHCPWMQGQAVDVWVSFDTSNRSKLDNKDHRTYFCRSLDRVCWRMSNTDSESRWSLVYRYTSRFLQCPPCTEEKQTGSNHSQTLCFSPAFWWWNLTWPRPEQGVWKPPGQGLQSGP